MSARTDTAGKVRDRLGRPVRDLRISVMDTCNYRCPYCMPAEKFDENYQFLRPHERLNFDEIVTVAEAFACHGVNKLRLTGGEPLLRKNLAQLVQRLNAIAGIEDIALTTNGLLLSRQLPDLVAAGLKRVTISLDSLDPDQYRRLSGNKGDLPVVLRAIDDAMNSPLQAVKINCVIQRGLNEEQILPILERFRHTPVVVRFIEFMDVGNKNDWQPEKVMTAAEILEIIQAHWPVQPLKPNYRGEVAARYAYADGAGEIGFITSISQPFCGDCSRARLSADGKVYTCLFSSKGHDLRPLLRPAPHRPSPETPAQDTVAALRQEIADIWARRSDRYSEKRTRLRRSRDAASGNKIEMYVIGG